MHWRQIQETWQEVYGIRMGEIWYVTVINLIRYFDLNLSCPICEYDNPKIHVRGPVWG